MAMPAAKQGDQIVGVDFHIVMVPSAAGPVPTPLPHPFVSIINGGLSTNVMIMGMPAATIGSTSQHQPPHIPTPPGVSFQVPPKNMATIQNGSMKVLINGKPAARSGDIALSCNDPADMPVGTVVAAGTVIIG